MRCQSSQPSFKHILYTDARNRMKVVKMARPIICILFVLWLNFGVACETENLFISTNHTIDNASAFTGEDSLLATVIQSSGTADKSPAELKAKFTNNKKKWITKVLEEARSKFDMHSKVSEKCKRDYEIYQQNLSNQTVWAVRMMESSDWPRVGLFTGGNNHFGHFAACLKSEGPGIRGRYCLVKMAYNFTLEDTEKVTLGRINWPDESVSAWKVVNMYETINLRFPRQTLTWAMCIPSSCTASDLQISVDNILRPLFEDYGFNSTVNVAPKSCSVQKSPSFTRGYYYARSIFTLLIALMLSATLYEIVVAGSQVHEKEFKKEVLPLKLFRCFSAVRSWKMLTDYSDNTYAVLYFIKTVCTILITAGHTVFFRYISSQLNGEATEMETYKSWYIVLLIPNIINVFLIISGFLTAFHFDFTPTKKSGIGFFIQTVVSRWLRMNSVLGLSLLYIIFLQPEAIDGPLRQRSMASFDSNYCSSVWWKLILTLPSECFRGGWYTGVDIQLSIFGTLLLSILRGNRKLGILSMVFAFISSFVYVFVIIYWNKSTGVLRFAPKSRHSFAPVYFGSIYRLGPYLIGCATAILTKWLMRRKYTFSRMQILTLLPVLSVIGIGIQFYTFKFYMVGRPYYVLENAIFGAFNAILFSLPFAAFICIYFISGFGAVNAIFERKIFAPVGRLGYCMYLVSVVFQITYNASQKGVLYQMGGPNLYWSVLGDMVYSIFLAFAVFLISEGPVCSMLKLWRASLKRLE